MSTIWIPIAFTLIFAGACYADYKDDWEKIKKDWAIFLLAIAIKPGLFVAAVWALWFLGNMR